MKKVITIVLIMALSVSTLAGCGLSKMVDDAKSSISSTGISELKFLKADNVALNVGDTTGTSYFAVKASGTFSVNDIDFVSSDKSVATFEYDNTALTTCIYYKITGIAPGTATVYAQTKDGIVKSEVITVTVKGQVSSDGTEIKMNYKIADQSYANIGDVARMVDRVTISEADMNKATNDDITQFLKALTKKQIEAHKPDALMIFLYCEGDKTDSQYTIARSIYAPAGKWENTLNDANDEYTGYDYTIDINTPSARDMLRSLD